MLAIISFISPIPVFNFLDTAIKNTMLTKFLYDNNVFVTLLKIGLNM